MLRKLSVFLLLTAAAALFAVEPLDWSKGKTVQKGVLHLKIETDQPRLMKINILRIDLQTPNLDFTATDRDRDWGKPMPDYKQGTIRTKRIRTQEFLRNARRHGINMIVAVNAAPWSPWTKPFNHKYGDPSGINILNGKIISDHDGRGPTFLIRDDGTPAIMQRIPKEDYGKIKVAVSGFSIIARNGQPTINDKQLAPRTAYGISADGKYLYILGIDGRQPKWSMGSTCREAGEWLIAAGAKDAINMDGGGSTTLVYWDSQKKKPVSLCRHSESGYERPVASNLGIFLKK